MSDSAAPPDSFVPPVGLRGWVAAGVNWAARAALIAGVCAVPWVWGGVLPAQRAWACGAVAVAAGLAAAGALLDRRAGRVPAFGLFLLGPAAVGGLQLLGGVSGAMGPVGEALGEVLPWWRPATVGGPATRAAVADGLAAGGAVVLGAALFGRVGPRRALCWAVAGTAAAVAFLGVAALVRPTLSVFPDPGVGRPFGPFVNRNNACALLCAGAAAAAALALDPSLGRARGGEDRGGIGPAVRGLAAILGAACAAGVLASASRGGALALCAGGAGALFAVRLPAAVRLWGGTLAAAAAVLLVGWLDLLGRLFGRLGGGGGLLGVGGDGRLAHWADVLPAALDRPLWGFGAGTYAIAHLPYEDLPGAYTHVDADGMPVQWALEIGAAGLATVLIGGLWAARAAWRRARGTLRVPGVTRGGADGGNRLPPGPLAAAGVGGTALAVSLAAGAAFDFGVTLAGVFLPAGALLGTLCGARPGAADFAPPPPPEPPPAAAGPKPRRRPKARIPVRGAAPAKRAPGPTAAPAFRRSSLTRPRPVEPLKPPRPAAPLRRRLTTALTCSLLAAGCGWGWAERRSAATVAAAVRGLPPVGERDRWTTRDLAEAPDRLAAALAARPDDPDGLAALGAAHVLRYRFAAADAVRPATPEFTDAQRWRLTDPEGLHLAAANWLAAGRRDRLAQLAADPRVAADLPAAREAYLRLKAATPWDPRPPRPLAELAFLGELEPAEGDGQLGGEPIRLGHALLNGRPEDQLALGRLAWSGGADDLAAACWRRALALAPTPADALPEIAARLRPEPAWPANLLAVLPEDPAVLAAAAAMGAGAAPPDPDRPAFLNRVLPAAGAALPAADRERLAKSAAELLAEPGVPAGVRAAAYASLGRDAEAREAFEDLLRENPADPAARVRFAGWLFDVHRAGRGEPGTLAEAAALARDARALAQSAGSTTVGADRLLARLARAADRAR